MKILHTADLHLGKTLHEVSLFASQKKMLGDLCTLLAQDNYAALIIAGDIYDRCVPSAESVSLFSSFLQNIKRSMPRLPIYLIPGNHDSAQRLSFAQELLKQQGVFIAQDPEESTRPHLLCHEGETVQLFLLPFLHAGAFSYLDEENTTCLIHTQSELLQEDSRRLQRAVSLDTPSILVAHLFTQKGISCESERPFVGNAVYADPHWFDFFTYVALGHLHKCQKITERMYYSGSPLPYSFDEANTQKVALSVEIHCNTKGFPIHVTPLPLEPLIPLRTIRDSFHALYTGDRYLLYQRDFLEITLTDPALVHNPIGLLKPRYPGLLSIKQENAFAFDIPPPYSSNEGIAPCTHHSLRTHFDVFMHEVSPTPDDREKGALFQELFDEMQQEFSS